MSDNIKIIADKVEIDEIAEAVREKTKLTNKMSLGQIARNIRGMSEGGLSTSDATITSGDQMLEGITAYGANGKITGTIPSQDAKTITPTKSTQTAISAGTYAEGDIIVKAIPDEYITTTDATVTSEKIFLNETAYVNGEKVTGSFTIDEEVTTQEEKIAAQDTIIADIVSALEGKTAGGGEIELMTTTISEDQLNGQQTITIPELIGAKYFIIQGNPLTGKQSEDMVMVDDSGNIHSIIYLNGQVTVYFAEFGGSANTVAMACENVDNDIFSFDETTGTISFTPPTGGYFFCKISTDTSTTGIAYTVYRIG